MEQEISPPQKREAAVNSNRRIKLCKWYLKFSQICKPVMIKNKRYMIKQKASDSSLCESLLVISQNEPVFLIVLLSTLPGFSPK